MQERVIREEGIEGTCGMNGKNRFKRIKEDKVYVINLNSLLANLYFP